MENRLIIRADGGTELGLGHWSRCLFLVSCYRKVAPDLGVTLFTKSSADFKSAFPDTDLAVFQIGAEEEFIDEVTEEDILLLDGYFFTKEYFFKLTQKKALTIYIDDLLAFGIWADVIINHALGTTPANYRSVAPYAAFYVGANFSMVPDIFSKSKIGKDERLENILICMGGADPTNRTAFILGAYRNFLNRFENVYVVTGQQYQHADSLVEHQNVFKNLQILKGIDKDQVAALMKKCGTAILPASTMAIEYAHVGGLLVIIKTAENQDHLSKGLLTERVAKSLKDVISARDISIDYDQLSQMQIKLFDGLSRDRFTKLFKEIELQKKVMLRETCFDDVLWTFNWASDKNVRKYSFSTNEITWPEHQKWFRLKLEDQNCLYLIAESEGKKVGSIRFDIKDDEALISYLLDRRYQGKGLGRIILSEGLKYLIENRKDFRYVVGFVIPENKTSIRIFERLGFTKEAGEGKLKYFKELIDD